MKGHIAGEQWNCC